MEAKENKNMRKKLRFLCQAMALIVVLVVLLVAVLLVLAQRKPRAYDFSAATDQVQQVSPYLTHYLAPNVHNNIQLDAPFEVVVPQKGINEIIAEEDLIGWQWPVEFSKVTIFRPVAIFEFNTIILMGKVDIIGFDTVVTLCATPTLGKEGALTLNMQYVRAGSLDITFLAKKTIKRVVESQMEELGSEYWLQDILNACMHNKPFDPVFPTVYDKYIRLVRSDISKGKLVLVFEPGDQNETYDNPVADKGFGNSE
jgi:uncharacterized protein YpmS